jgi:hypothetical protein
MVAKATEAWGHRSGIPGADSSGEPPGSGCGAGAPMIASTLTTPRQKPSGVAG